MRDLLSALKNERQQCQYKNSEGHKILECKIYHRHHLHSWGNEGNATLFLARMLDAYHSELCYNIGNNNISRGN